MKSLHSGEKVKISEQKVETNMSNSGRETSFQEGEGTEINLQNPVLHIAPYYSGVGFISIANKNFQKTTVIQLLLNWDSCGLEISNNQMLKAGILFNSAKIPRQIVNQFLFFQPFLCIVILTTVISWREKSQNKEYYSVPQFVNFTWVQFLKSKWNIN